MLGPGGATGTEQLLVECMSTAGDRQDHPGAIQAFIVLGGRSTHFSPLGPTYGFAVP